MSFIKFFKFSSLVPDVKVAVQNEAFDIAKYPATASLIACASKLGNLAVVTVDGTRKKKRESQINNKSS